MSIGKGCVMYGCESWSIQKAECWRIDPFELWCWGRLLRVPWTERKSSQSILKEINPEDSLEGLMLKLKLNTLATWCEEPAHWKRPWCRERLKAGGEGDDRGWDGWMASPSWWTWAWVSSRSWWWTGVGDGDGKSLVCCSPWGHKESVTTEQLNWTELWALPVFLVPWWETLFIFTPTLGSRHDWLHFTAEETEAWEN